MSEHGIVAPLLPQPHPDGPVQPSDSGPPFPAIVRLRAASCRLLASRRKHFVVMSLVALDVAALLANVFIRLIACEMHQRDEPWVEAVTEGLEVAGLVFSSLFVVELAACLFAFGLSYFTSWFHVFDSAVIVVSFLIDIGSRGLAESIGSLIVVLRLWRLAKISEEVVMGAAERMEVLEQQLEELENENKHLRAHLGMDSQEHSGHE